MSRSRADTTPPCRVRSDRWRVGVDVFDRLGLLVPAGEPTPAGLVDTLHGLAHAGFVPGDVDDEVRRFYERTADYRLTTTPSPAPWFRPLGAAWNLLARSMRQMTFPLDRSGAVEASSTLRHVRADRDSRRGTRVWIRTWSQSGGTRVLYTALYATRRSGGSTYLDITFPLPWANLTSVLRFTNRVGGGTALSTRDADGASEAGVWLVTARRRWRTPITESIRVRRALADAHAEVVADHDLWLFGHRFLSLRYDARRR